MLKEKWQKLLLREKVLLISVILVILSIPLTLITLVGIKILMTFFVISVFYNLYKYMQTDNSSISEAIETDIKKGQQEFNDGKKVSGALRAIALPLAIGMCIPMVLILLIYMWIAI